MNKVVFIPTDLLGQQIRVGDIITYPGRQSSALWMNHAVVREILFSDGFHGVTMKLKVTSVHLDSWNQNINVKKTTITAVDRVTVLPTIIFDRFIEWQRVLLNIRDKILLPKSSTGPGDLNNLPIG